MFIRDSLSRSSLRLFPPITSPAENEWNPPMERSTSNICTACKVYCVSEKRAKRRGDYKFTGRRDHEGSQTILRAPLSAIENLKNGYQER